MINTSIIVKNLSVKLHGNTVLDDLSFEVNQREHIAITGVCGSGKTMLAKTLSGQLFHHGTIDVHFDNESFLKQKLIFVEQHYHFKNLSNQSGFYYQQRYNSFDSEDAATVEQELMQIEKEHDLIDIWLTRFGMQHRKYSPLIQLSSGEHKRFQLIKAFLSRPQFLVLDNPFIGLDRTTREQLLSIINKATQHGTKIIIICNENEIPSCITHVISLDKGKIKCFESKEIFIAAQARTLTSYSSFQIEKITLPKIDIEFTDAVKMKNISVQYGNKKILQNINWQVKQGERWLVKGPNGVGKSTLLSLVTGDNPKAYANEIYLFDRRRGSGESIWDIKQKIGYVSPELHWYFDTTISCGEVVGSGFFDTIGIFKSLAASQQKNIQQWLDFLNLSYVTKKPFATVSTGQQRLILLARAFIKNPPLLVLDEPCQGLDEIQTHNFVTLVDALCTQLNKTLIYVSHYENEVPSCITKVLAFEQNRYTISTINKKETIAA